MLKTTYYLTFVQFKLLPAVLIIFSLFIIVGIFIFPLPTHGQSLPESKYIFYPETKFAVITDPHVFEVEGNIDDPIYLKYGVEDRKLLKLSTEILEKAVNEIIKREDIDFVILPGDLTDSGDIKSHQVVAKILGSLKSNGIQVYIIPGNHDGFKTKDYDIKKIPREIVTPEEFTKIYNDCGYDSAIYKDNQSLSYVAEPVKGLWLLMVDSCIYNSPDNYHVCNGRVRESTKIWIDDILKKAKKQNKAVIGSLHHSLLEHYKGHQRFFSNYIVDDFEALSQHFAAQNIKVIFTGHHHAQDIVKKEFENEKFIYDIETSSLIGYPNAYRVVQINKNNEMIIKSEYIRELNSFEENFSSYTKNYVRVKVKQVAEDKLEKYYLKIQYLDKISDKAADAMIAHYQGNEMAPDTLKIKGLDLWSIFIYGFYKNLLTSLYEDSPPTDLNIKINLRTGSWSNLD